MNAIVLLCFTKIGSGARLVLFSCDHAANMEFEYVQCAVSCGEIGLLTVQKQDHQRAKRVGEPTKWKMQHFRFLSYK